VRKIPAAVRRAGFETNSPNRYMKSQGLTSIVQNLFKTNRILVLRRTSKNRKFFSLENVLFLHILAIVFH
jgi:hypothetical protein